MPGPLNAGSPDRVAGAPFAGANSRYLMAIFAFGVGSTFGSLTVSRPFS